MSGRVNNSRTVDTNRNDESNANFDVTRKQLPDVDTALRIAAAGG